ncbi:MAG: YdcF family protein [Clostridia bacterium]|nr:YdcF family protein [Clostridia bacterium]
MRTYDAILLLGLKLKEDGSPRPELMIRIRKAAECWKKEKAPLIITCGGRTPGTPVSEAQVMKRELEKLGIPAAAIRMEDRSQITVENFINARKILAPARPCVLIVTSDYHMLRSRMICRFSAGMRCRGSKARIPRSQVRTQRLKEPLHLIDYMLGFQTGRFRRPGWYLKLMHALFRRIETE